LDTIRWIYEQLYWVVFKLPKPENLQKVINLGGPHWVAYVILFAIIFSETGLLIGFFLPGDSLLFAAGFLASKAGDYMLNIVVLNVVLMVAAILGDAVNYHLGQKMGEKVFDKGHMRFVKHDHLMAAKEFYDRHGGIAIVLARFVPLVRTFTPFVAGVAKMRYREFVIYNVLGGIGWVLSMTMAGYFLGGFKIIAENFEKVVLLIIFVSVLPVFIGGVRKWRSSRKKSATASSATAE
jgi:membrane-associated protein